MKDERLEKLIEDVRNGIPIPQFEILGIMKYQDKQYEERRVEDTWWYSFKSVVLKILVDIALRIGRNGANDQNNCKQ